MSRRNVIGCLLAVGVLVANVAAWRWRGEPEAEIPDNRAAMRTRFESQWADAPAVGFDTARAELTQRLTVSLPPEIIAKVRSRLGGDTLETLPADVRSDLIAAVADALAVVAANDARRLETYMTRRGMTLNRGAVMAVFADLAEHDPSIQKPGPAEPFSALWDRLAPQPHWQAWVPEATRARVWRPRSLNHVSMSQVGVNESWVWGNQTTFASLFGARPSYPQVSRRQPALLADVRTVIEHGGPLAGERSPYFFRLWWSKDNEAWLPLALKLVRTTTEPSQNAPRLFF